MALTAKSITEYAKTIEKFTNRLNSEGLDLAEAKNQGKVLVNGIVDGSIAINQKIDFAVITSRTQPSA